MVVTGIGLVTPLGVGAQRSWDALVAGEVATRRLEGAEFAALPCRVAGTVPRGSGAGLFDAEALPHAPASRNAPFVQMALVAADEALADADGGAASQHRTINGVWGDGAEARCAVCVGSGIGALSEIVSAGAAVNKGQHRKVSPFFVPKVLLNMAGAQIAIRHGIRGPNHTLVTACAAGAHNIIDAAKLIALGDADVALAGGSESCVEPLALAGFARAKALATDFNDSPLEASRPFDAKRCGFVMGEGAGVVVLEEYEIAKRRGAKIYAEVRGWAQAASARESGCDWLGRDTLKRKHVHVCMHKHAHTPRNAHIQRTAHKQVRGWGSGGDAYHITSPVEDGTGAAHVMQQALSVAGLPPSAVFLVYVSSNTRPHSPPPIPPPPARARTHTHTCTCTHMHMHTQVGHINCHATSTPTGDGIETRAIARAFPDCPDLHISSNKGNMGHLLGAAGAVEAAVTILSLYHQKIPATANLERQSEDVHPAINIVKGRALDVCDMQVALSNSFGFGGVNAALLFARV